MGFTTNLAIALVIITMCMTTISGILLVGTLEYEVEVDEQYQETFNDYAQLQAQTYQQSDILDQGDIDPDASDQAVFTNVITASQQVRSTAQIAQTAGTDIVDILGAKSFILGMIMTIVIILGTSGFIALFFGGKSP